MKLNLEKLNGLSKKISEFKLANKNVDDIVLDFREKNLYIFIKPISKEFDWDLSDALAELECNLLDDYGYLHVHSLMIGSLDEESIECAINGLESDE